MGAFVLVVKPNFPVLLRLLALKKLATLLNGGENNLIFGLLELRSLLFYE